jgi:hypothetical protein
MKGDCSDSIEGHQGIASDSAIKACLVIRHRQRGPEQPLGERASQLGVTAPGMSKVMPMHTLYYALAIELRVWSVLLMSGLSEKFRRKGGKEAC